MTASERQKEQQVQLQHQSVVIGRLRRTSRVTSLASASECGGWTIIKDKENKNPASAPDCGDWPLLKDNKSNKPSFSTRVRWLAASARQKSNKSSFVTRI